MPEIIRAAASSTLGIVALLLIGAGTLLYLMFKEAPFRIRVPLFAAVVTGAFLLVVAMISHASSSSGEQVELPGHTGWLFLGYFNVEDSTFDAEGPRFAFEKRKRTGGPFIPSNGDILSLSAVRRVMIHGYMPNHSTVGATDLICADYDENRDDTGVRLAKGTKVVVREVGHRCYDSSKGKMAALWVRVGEVAR